MPRDPQQRTPWVIARLREQGAAYLQSWGWDFGVGSGLGEVGIRSQADVRSEAARLWYELIRTPVKASQPLSGEGRGGDTNTKPFAVQLNRGFVAHCG